MSIIETKSPVTEHINVLFKRELVESPSAEGVALNVAPATIALVLFLVSIVLGVVTSVPVVVFLSGVGAALLVPVFAFADLYARVQK